MYWTADEVARVPGTAAIVTGMKNFKDVQHDYRRHGLRRHASELRRLVVAGRLQRILDISRSFLTLSLHMSSLVIFDTFIIFHNAQSYFALELHVMPPREHERHDRHLCQ